MPRKRKGLSSHQAWKQPTKAEIDQLRAECRKKKLSQERTEIMIACARRSLDEEERDGRERLASIDAEVKAQHPELTLEERRVWYDELRGYHPPRQLPPEAAVYLPNWIQDYRKRRPLAPLPNFWIVQRKKFDAVWDGRCFIEGGGWEEVEPRPRRHHDAWALAFLYPSAAECLEAAIQVSAETGVDCEVQAHPNEAYYPPDSDGHQMFDLLDMKYWARFVIEVVNKHYNAGLDPQAPLYEWIRRGWLSPGTIYPANGLYFWPSDSRWRLWYQFYRKFAPPTYVKIIDRRGDWSSYEEKSDHDPR